MTTHGNILVSVRDPRRTLELNVLGQLCDVVAIAGIGNPSRFFSSLPVARDRLTVRTFSDHHRYTPSDLAQYQNRCVVMTEKDAVKIDFPAGEDWWYLPIRARLGEEPATKIDTAIRQLAVHYDPPPQ